MTDPFVFRAEWPITDDTLTLRELVAQGIGDLNRALRKHRAHLVEPPVWTARIEKGCPPKLIAEATARAGKAPLQRPPTKAPAVCGTDAGYCAHRRRGDQPCPPCREAHRAAERAREKRRRDLANAGTPIEGPRRLPIRHGTTGGYKTHLRRGETPCGECRAAKAAYSRARWHVYKQQRAEAS